MAYVSPSDSPRFKWQCSYQGCTWFNVWDHTGMYEIEFRQRADAYERTCYNGDDADWQRNVVAMIGVVRRSHDSATPIPDSTFRAFNTWRAAEHEKHLSDMRSQPQRYGTDFSDIKAPMLARAAAIYRDGWHITSLAYCELAFA
jgi:hypothetical protein